MRYETTARLSRERDHAWPHAHETGLKRASGFPALEGSKSLSFGEKQRIYEQGDTVTALYRILTGAVLLSRSTGDVKRQILEVLGPGSLIGICPDEVYDCRAETLSRVVVHRIDHTAAMASPELQTEISQTLVSSIARFRDRLSMTGRSTASRRLATVLLSLPVYDGSSLAALRTDPGSDQRIMLTQVELANYLSLSMETVCRALGAMKRDGIIDLPSRRRLVIHDPAKLALLARTP